MSQPSTASNDHFETLFAHPAAGAARSHVSEELFLLQDAATSAVTMLQFFREELSKEPRVDLKAAFVHIDNALSHSHGLLEALERGQTCQSDLVQHAINSLSPILSNIPQLSYMNNAMLRSYYETKDVVAKLLSFKPAKAFS